MLRIPNINPVTFYPLIYWDYAGYFPNEEDLPSYLSDYNVGRVHYVQPWLKGTAIQFELLQEYGDNVTVEYTVDDGARVPIAATDITPSGWAGDGNYVMLYAFTPSAEGRIKIYIEEEVESGSTERYASHLIDVRASLKECKKVEYLQSNNLMNAVFVRDGVRVFFPVIFLEATAIKPLIGGEYSTSQTPNKAIRMLRGTPTSGKVLEVHNVPLAMAEKLATIFSSDKLIINGVYYQSPDVPSVEHTEGSNTNTIEVEIYKTDWGYINNYVPVYAVTPPVCDVEDDLEYWFKRTGSVYVDQVSGTITLTESGGRLDFEPLGSELFNRNNVVIQDSNKLEGYQALKPYSYSLSEVSMKGFADMYNDGYAGRVYVKGNRDEILVYKTDKVLACDATILKYCGFDKFATDPIGGENILKFNKYNIITI